SPSGSRMAGSMRSSGKGPSRCEAALLVLAAQPHPRHGLTPPLLHHLRSERSRAAVPWPDRRQERGRQEQAPAIGLPVLRPAIARRVHLVKSLLLSWSHGTRAAPRSVLRHSHQPGLKRLLSPLPGSLPAGGL